MNRQDGLHLPGGEWIYVKLYGPRSVQDEVLLEFVTSLLEPWERELGSRINWFFVRYADVGDHLRIRLQLLEKDSFTNAQQRIRSFSQALISQRVLSSISYDSYFQELTRYGGRVGTAFAEKFFFEDARVVVAVLRHIKPSDRLPVVAYCVYDLLRSFGFDAGHASVWLTRVASQRQVVGPKYRALQLTLHNTLAFLIPGIPPDLIETLRASGNCCSGRGQNSGHGHSLMESLVHMHCNRTGLDNQAEAELMGLLCRAVDSLRSRGKDTFRVGERTD